MSWAKRFWPELPAWWPFAFATAILWWLFGTHPDLAPGYSGVVPLILLITYHYGAETGWARRIVYENERRESREQSLKEREA